MNLFSFLLVLLVQYFIHSNNAKPKQISYV